VLYDRQLWHGAASWRARRTVRWRRRRPTCMVASLLNHSSRSTEFMLRCGCARGINGPIAPTTRLIASACLISKDALPCMCVSLVTTQRHAWCMIHLFGVAPTNRRQHDLPVAYRIALVRIDRRWKHCAACLARGDEAGPVVARRRCCFSWAFLDCCFALEHRQQGHCHL
jgi:hypothetical protein